MNKYDDIINLNRPISKYKHLSMDARAAQFAPFAALVGYDSAVKETARLTEKEIEIDDGLKEILDNKLNYLSKNITDKNKVEVTYFVKDDKKSGGKYLNKKGIIKRINQELKTIKFDDGFIINIENIINITRDIFNEKMDNI